MWAQGRQEAVGVEKMRVRVARIEFDPAKKLSLRSRPIELEVRVDKPERGMRRRDGIVYLKRLDGSLSRIDHHFSGRTKADHRPETIGAGKFGVGHCVSRFDSNGPVEWLNRAFKCWFGSLILGV